MNYSSEQLDQLYTALAAFNKAYPNLSPDKKNYRNEYVSYHTAMQAVRPILAQQGLSITGGSRYIDNTEYYVTQIVHSSGQWEAYMTPIILKDKEDRKQQIGERRRTQIFSILGITNYKEDAVPFEKAISLQQVQFLAELIKGRSEITLKILKRFNINTLDRVPLDKFEDVISYVRNQ